MTSAKSQITTLPKHLVGFSTKTYFTLTHTTAYVEQLLALLPKDVNSESIGIFVIPSFPAIPLVSEVLVADGHAQQKQGQSNTTQSCHEKQARRVWLGAQNCNAAPPGAFTGEVSAPMCSDAGCIMVEIGHAERRASPFNEDDKFIAAKAQAVVAANMIPLVCIGERDRPATSGPVSVGVGAAVAECAIQIQAVLAAVPDDAAVIFAYEPVWAIGASHPAGGDYVRAVVSGMRAIDGICQRAGHVRWLYGGSAGPGVWAEMGSRPNQEGVDGLFLGRFAHDVQRMVDVIQEVQSTA